MLVRFGFPQFLTRNDISFVFCIYLSNKVRKDPPKLEISKKTSHIRILIFLTRSHVPFVFGLYNSLTFEKPRKDPQNFEILRKTSQIRIPRGGFRGGGQSRNHRKSQLQFCEHDVRFLVSTSPLMGPGMVGMVVYLFTFAVFRLFL